MKQIELPLACPECESLNIKVSLVAQGNKNGVGVLCLDCLIMSIFTFKLLKKLLNARKKDLKAQPQTFFPGSL